MRDAHGKAIDLKLNEIIDELRDRKVISNIIAGNWHRLQGIRNKVFHAMVLAPTEGEIRALVREVIEIDVSNREIERTRQGKIKKT